MNKKQWFVFGIGFIVFSGYMFVMASPTCYSMSNELLTACYVRRYAHGIPALISTFLGLMFIICGWLEKEK